ncbi:helix-turn-helix domain-containing protein [Streptomyces sp. NPDC008265]|uniref:helix-turn-helix domain-containing protein n=1 Tax=Streptomyces sp. NPDC008265 TaxID=3364824 RepID=UPI0036EF0C79
MESDERFHELLTRLQESHDDETDRSFGDGKARTLALLMGERMRRMRSRQNQLAVLMDMVRDMGEQRNLHGLVTTVVRRSRLLLDADLTLLSLTDPQGELVLRAADGASNSSGWTGELPDTLGVGAEAARRRAPVCTADWFTGARSAHRLPADGLLRAEQIRTLLAVPLCTADRVIGVLYCGHREIRTDNAAGVGLLSTIAEYATGTLQQSLALGEALSHVARITSKYDRLRAAVRSEQEAVRAGGRLVDSVLAGADAHDLVAETARVFDGAAAVRDRDGRTVARQGDIPEADAALDRAVLEARAENRAVELTPDITVLPVRGGGSDLGAVIFRRRDQGSTAGRQVFHHAARAAAVLAMITDTGAEDCRSRDETLDLMLSTPPRDRQQAVEWGRRLGLDLSQPHVVVVARIGTEHGGRALAWAAPYLSRRGGAKTVREDTLVLLTPGGDPGAAARDVAQKLGAALGRPVSAGAASASGRQDALQNGYQQAVRCVDALGQLGQVGSGATLEELGFVGLLLGEGRDVGGFIDETIGAVLTYDEERSTHLEQTLAAYFAAGGSPTYAAEALNVHTNTVSRRLDRITQLLGADWQESGRSLEIQLALRLQRVRTALHDRGGRA